MSLSPTPPFFLALQGQVRSSATTPRKIRFCPLSGALRASGAAPRLHASLHPRSRHRRRAAGKLNSTLAQKPNSLTVFVFWARVEWLIGKKCNRNFLHFGHGRKNEEDHACRREKDRRIRPCWRARGRAGKDLWRDTTDHLPRRPQLPRQGQGLRHEHRARVLHGEPGQPSGLRCVYRTAWFEEPGRCLAPGVLRSCRISGA